MSRAVLYVRVSTADQVDNYSLETQEKECRRYCERQGLVVDRIFREEGESAKTVNRTQLQEMLRYLGSNSKKRGITSVVVYRVDRLAREVGGHHTIKAALGTLNISLESVMERFDASPTGKLTENLMAVLAQFDNDLRSQRTTDGMKAAIAHGRWVWRAPVGFRAGSKGEPSMVLDPALAPVVREIFQRVAAGESKDLVRRSVAVRGIVTKNQLPFSPGAFQRLLENRLYIGEIVVRKWGVTRQGDFEALIDRETFALAQLSIAKNGAHAQCRALDNDDFPLRRVVRCGPCATPLTASWSTSRSGKKYAYYHCRNRQCHQVNVRKEALEKAFEAWLGEMSVPAPVFTLLSEVVHDVVAETRIEQEGSRTRIEHALKKLDIREERLIETYLEGRTLSEEVFKKHLAKIEVERVNQREELALLLVNDFDVDEVLAKAQSLLSDLPTSWNHLKTHERQQFLRFFVPEGLHYEEGVVGTTQTPSAIRGIMDLTHCTDRLAVPTGFEPVPPP
jgi:site-specific DNA recombinase